MPVSRILIANRGEIACRVIRTARAMGIETVAVFSEADRHARHVRLADRALGIGPALAKESYLSIPRLIDAARQSGADAVHPGYGFLSENEHFAAACAEAGLAFIGPPAAAIAAMGNKAAAKRRMIEAGVPCVPGYQGADQDDARLIDEAKRIGLPVMVKAAAGGGGRGMRLVAEAADLAAAIASARSEAENAFGSGELILEKAVVDARHVEIQVFADTHGRVVHLGERDCSAQRRHQKVIEEAPSPAVDAALRNRMGAAAVAAAKAIGYVGAGTVEFLLGGNGEFYFLEMNTRLQVEHPVTECITGLDLVEWQIRVARGEPLPLAQSDIELKGHAIEVRLYAEDPAKNFLPQSGRVVAWTPPEGEGVRVDHGVDPGQDISPWYDPMVAKVVAYGANRTEARERLVGALRRTLLLGPVTNRDFLIDLLRHPVFADRGPTTAFIPTCFPPKTLAASKPGLAQAAVAALIFFERDAGRVDPLLRNWRSTGSARWPMRMRLAETDFVVEIAADGLSGRYVVQQGESKAELVVEMRGDSAMQISIDGVRQHVRFAFEDDVLHADLSGLVFSAEETLMRAGAQSDAAAATRFVAPMSGRIVSVLVAPKARVTKGQRLVILEAMKMQHEITARSEGVVDQVLVKEGDQVALKQLLVSLATEQAA